MALRATDSPGRNCSIGCSPRAAKCRPRCLTAGRAVEGKVHRRVVRCSYSELCCSFCEKFRHSAALARDHNDGMRACLAQMVPLLGQIDAHIGFRPEDSAAEAAAGAAQSNVTAFIQRVNAAAATQAVDIFRHKAGFRSTLADKPEPIRLPGDLHTFHFPLPAFLSQSNVCVQALPLKKTTRPAENRLLCDFVRKVAPRYFCCKTAPGGVRYSQTWKQARHRGVFCCVTYDARTSLP